MRIRDYEGNYWTEDDFGMGFWSSFEPLSKDKRDFNIIKSIVLYLAMLGTGIKPKLEVQSR